MLSLGYPEKMSSHGPILTTSRERIHVPFGLRLITRYLITGKTIRGYGDNASFLHAATVDYRGKPVARYSAARWKRVARRNAAITVPVLLTLAAPWIGTWPVLAYTASLPLAALVWGLVRLVVAVRMRKHYREWVDPAAQVACRVLNVPYRKRKGRRMLDVPRDWGTGAVREEGRQSVRLHIPVGTPLSAGVKKQVTENVGARLGIPTPIGDWREAGQDVTVDIKGSPVPPKEVTLASLMRAVQAAGECETVVGRAAGGGVVSVSTEEDSPHFAMSGRSGTGKSVLGKFFLAQRMNKGDGVIFLDPKRWSHWRWAGGGRLPADRATYAYRTADLHEAWLKIAEEAERRIELEEDELAELRRVWVCVEEINTQTKRLTRYWKGERKRIMNAAALAKAEDMDYDEADLDPPTTSPAIVAMQESVGMGREIKMHVVVMAQRLSASVFGGNGGDIRESFGGGRFIASWDRKLWKMLVDTIAYVACPTGTRGIWGIARGEDFTVFRAPYVQDAEATRMATSGRPATGPVLGQQTSRPVVDIPVVKELASGVPLSAALDTLPGQDGPRALSLEGLRTASKRPGFPAAVGQQGRAKLYDLDELVEWREGVLAVEVVE